MSSIPPPEQNDHSTQEPDEPEPPRKLKNFPEINVAIPKRNATSARKWCNLFNHWCQHDDFPTAPTFSCYTLAHFNTVAEILLHVYDSDNMIKDFKMKHVLRVYLFFFFQEK